MTHQLTDGGIYVHTSDTATFKRCRTRWNWSSPMRHNLAPKVAFQGINFNLAFGTAIHAALEHYYGNDRAEGGAVDLFTNGWTNLAMQVKEDNSLFFTEHEDEFSEHLDLGLGMLDNYFEWAKKHDYFEVVSMEHLFTVPTGLTANGLPVYYRGRMDMVIRDLDTGRYGIMDHKTSSRHGDEDYLAKLDMDEQVTRYCWAAEREAEVFDLPYKQIDFFYYNVLFKAYPRDPTITSRGWPSLDRQKESTTIERFAALVMSREDLKVWFKSEPKAQAYAEWLKEQGESRFLYREHIRRSRNELAAAGSRIRMEIEDMLSPTLNIYPNATGEWYCLKCPFRAPCLAAMDGSDVEWFLEQNYEQSMNKEGSYAR